MPWRGLTIAGFVAIGLSAVVLEIVARRGLARLPTFGALVSWAVRTRGAQFAVVLAWWWLGAHFFHG
jgi:hypothetical protein